MVLVKVLKRKDASSVVIAVIVAMVVFNLLQSLTATPAGRLLGLHEGQYPAYAYPGVDWKGQYLFPVVFAVLELLLLEVLGWVYVAVHSVVKK
jgi:hypothetical protein